jgi:hypothetical protein
VLLGHQKLFKHCELNKQISFFDADDQNKQKETMMTKSKPLPKNLNTKDLRIVTIILKNNNAQYVPLESRSVDHMIESIVGWKYNPQ